MGMLRNFVTAVQFLTVLPVSRRHAVDENDLARSMVYFPFVGFLIGVILAYADRLLLWLFPNTLANLFLLLVSAVLTRALHVDGLADSIDGITGGADPPSRLAIMKDSRIGTAGVLAVLFVFLAKYACLNSLFGDVKTSALLTAPVFGRWSQILMMFKADYGRDRGLGKVFVGHLRSGGLVAATVITAGLSAFVLLGDLQTASLAAVLPFAAAAFSVGWRWFTVRKLGGVTGDTVGAASELTETLVFALFVFSLTGRLGT